MRYYICLLFSTLLLGCTADKLAPQHIYDEVESGVVLICVDYKMYLELPEGRGVFSLDEEGNVSSVDDNVYHTAYGTGFFIDKVGTIMTNKHVVKPELDEEALKKVSATLHYKYEMDLQKAEEEYLRMQWTVQTAPSSSYNELIKMITPDNLSEYDNYKTAQKLLSFVSNIDEMRKHIRVFSSISIVYDNSEGRVLEKNPESRAHNSSMSKETAVIKKVSKHENIDLALIQINARKTPESCFVFNLEGKGLEKEPEGLKKLLTKDINSDLQIDDDLYMIGFNAGPILASTKNGVKSQLTSGKVTQTPDGERILYSIPTVEGSSGSPVVNAYGQLVGVNYAKLVMSDNFNFGIPINQVKYFMNE